MASASARLIRSASIRRVRILSDPESDTENTALLESENRRTSTIDSEVIEDELSSSQYAFGDLPIYENVWRIRTDILEAINDPYT